MTEYDFNQTTKTNLDNEVDDYSVSSYTLDAASPSGETSHTFDEASNNFGIYKRVPVAKQAVDALARWTAGRGYNTLSKKDEFRLENINGWGEDTLDSIFQNMIIVKKVVGDAFAEIIRNKKNQIINLKPISPERMKIVTNNKGIIIRYEEIDNKEKKKGEFKPQDILHISNDRVGDEIHGTSVFKSCRWAIEALEEALDTYRKIMKRALALGIIYVDSDDTDKLNKIKENYKDAVNKGEVMVVTGNREDISIEDSKVSVQDFVTWIRYLESYVFQSLGVPKSILGGTQEYTEAASKTSVFTFDQVWMTEQRLLEQDIWAQLAIKIKFNRPTSLKDEMQSTEQANTGQTSFQPKEAGLNMERE